MVAVASQICAAAKTPDQLLPYVRAVSGLKTDVCGECLLHHADGQGVLVGYPFREPQNMALVEDAVAAALEKRLERITVIAAEKPASAPAHAEVSSDMYWRLPLPLPPKSAKLRNLLKRAGREVEIGISSGGWTKEHEALVANFCSRKTLDEGTQFIFGKLAGYLAAAPDALLFSATTDEGRLAACAIGDYTAFSTAFYMFAFRNLNAPPGTADLLLAAIADEGEKRGHTSLNLGLGIDCGVEFFKKKWGAEPFLRCVETGWDIKKQRKGFLARIFGK